MDTIKYCMLIINSGENFAEEFNKRNKAGRGERIRTSPMTNYDYPCSTKSTI
jgi:hypothetical protein